MAYGSFEEGGITVESSGHTSEELAANLTLVVDDTVVVEESAEEGEPKAPVVAVEPKPKPRNDPQARVEAATAKEATAKRERDEAKAEAAKLTARIAELEARSKPEPIKAPVVTADPEPTVDQFDSYEKFVKAQARWEARQEFREQVAAKEKQDRQQQHQQGQREIERQFGERYRSALAADPEFVERVNPVLLSTPRVGVLPEGTDATFDNFLVEQVFRSRHPKELLLHLSDPATYQRFATLHPIEVLGELAIFNHSQGAASPAAPAPKVPVSHAKPPIQPLGTSHVTGTDPNEITGEESVDEHIRKMNAADRRARRAS